MSVPPARPLTTSELLTHPAVIQALEEAWIDSQVDDKNNRHEEGGWIYMELTTGIIVTQRAAQGTRSRLSLANPPLLPNRVIVGTFHTHPNPASEAVADWAEQSRRVSSKLQRRPVVDSCGGWEPSRRTGQSQGRPGWWPRIPSLNKGKKETRA